MSGYTKNVAIIKGLKEGFSADGGQLSGLVRAEKYGSQLKVEISLINFAPMSEGRYVAAISDGVSCEIIENMIFEGESEVDTSAGFAAVICYVHGGVSLIASAICGGFTGDTLILKDAIARAEGVKAEGAKKEPKPDNSRGAIENTPVYEDEAIAEVNYYEFAQASEDGQPVREDPPEEKDGGLPSENEAAAGAVEEKPRRLKVERGAALARGGFYEARKKEIEGLLSTYPAEERLNALIEGGSFVKISYGGGKFYVFGIIREDDRPAYICYGVPSSAKKSPPESMQNMASFLPVDEDSGYYMMYQDAETGASIKMTVT